MRSWVSLLVPMLIMGLWAGCLAPDAALGPAGALPRGWAEAAIGAEGHDHQDPGVHSGRSTPNFHVLGHDPLVLEATGSTAGSHWCGDTKVDDGRSISITHSWRGDAGLVVVDTTDPSDPFLIGELILPSTQVYDVALSDDQRFAVLGTSPLDAGPDELPGTWRTQGPPDALAPMWRDACGQTKSLPVPLPDQLPYAAGVILVDLSDLASPAIADYRPLPAMGAHSVRMGAAGGQTLIAASVFGYFAYPLGYLAILSIDVTGGGPALILESAYVQPDVPPEAASGASTVHDAWIADHPVTGTPLVYAAYGSTGLFMLDVSDPADPQAIGAMTDWSGLGGTNGDRVFSHAVIPATETWDTPGGPKHFTFVGEECPQPRPDTPSCLVVILDTTDPTAPAYVGAWTLPVYTPTWEHGYQFSTHYFAIADGTLFTSMYHGGVWAADVSTPEARSAPPTIGVFLPVGASPAPAPAPNGALLLDSVLGTAQTRGTPFVLDLDARADGTLIVYDADSGLYTVRFDNSDPAPAPPVFPTVASRVWQDTGT